MKMRWMQLLILSVICGAISCRAVEVNWSSACDFIETSLTLKSDNPDDGKKITLNVTLNKLAAARLARLSRDSLHQNMTLYINGNLISTATIQSVLGAQLQVPLSRQLAEQLIPTLFAEPKDACNAGD
ncbi:hypothetical protein [Burkholderia ubonensis]|uniref:hypothetical protein n=1 Tax=Burkholderia ubonensis TaxID=101571 RepID=UPI000A81869B|nr:hypothetical protein [Burkholderia ubonensis]